MTDHLDSQIRDLENAVASAKESLRISEVALAMIRESLSGAQPEKKSELPNIIPDHSTEQLAIRNPLNRAVT